MLLAFPLAPLKMKRGRRALSPILALALSARFQLTRVSQPKLDFSSCKNPHLPCKNLYIEDSMYDGFVFWAEF